MAAQVGSGGPAEPVRELRRSYHDRIAAIRDLSIRIVEMAGAGVESATRILVGDGGGPPPDLVRPAAVIAAEVDAEVVRTLALESPVARDLRMVLAARDVTQIGVLCVGLSDALLRRAPGAQRVLTPDLCRLVGGVGDATAALLRQAGAAWMALDGATAAAVAEEAAGVRSAHLDFFAALLGLTGVPMDAALDLGMTARAYERLTDHAIEIADRAAFALGGSPLPPL